MSKEETKEEDTVEDTVEDTEDESVTDAESDYSSDPDLDAQLSGGDPLKCRMYRRDYPQKGDLVIVQVKKIVEMGAYCNLKEYNNLEGMLLMSELQRRRIRSVKKVIKEGRQEIVQVVRVNKEKHFIDLSKKRVDADEIPAAEEKWNKSKAAHSIMRQVSKLSLGYGNYSMKDLYHAFGWDAAKEHGHLYDALKYAMNNWDAFLEKHPKIPEDMVQILQRNITKRLKPQMVTIRAKVEITCFTYEGVDGIKRALKAGLAKDADRDGSNQDDLDADEDTRLKIKLVAPPLFTVSVSTYDAKAGKQLVNDAVQAMHDSITESKGTLNIKQNAEVLKDLDMH